MSLGLSQKSKWTHLGVDQTDCAGERDGDKSLSWLHTVTLMSGEQTAALMEHCDSRCRMGLAWWWREEVADGGCILHVWLCFWLCLTLWLPLIMDCGLCHPHSIPCYCVDVISLIRDVITLVCSEVHIEVKFQFGVIYLWWNKDNKFDTQI